MDIFAVMFVCIVVFFICSLCGICCRKRRNDGFIYSTPVVVTSSTHTGPYPVTVGGGVAPGSNQIVTQSYSSHMAPPQPGFNPYPPMGQQQGYPPMQSQPYPPYPVNNTPYPIQGSSMPQPHMPAAVVNPPPYEQVVGGEVYQKQSPYNPGFSS